MTALLVIDVQNDFCPGGALAVPRGDEVVPVINRLLERSLPAAFTQDWHPHDHRSFASQHDERAAFESVEMPYGPQVLWPDHCVQGTRGAEFHPALNSDRAELIVRKGFRRGIDSYSAFRENDGSTTTGLEGYLRERGIDHVLAVGLATDFCVRWSVEDARRAGFDVTVIKDAVRGIDLDGSVDQAWDAMLAAGASVVSADEWLATATP